MLTNLVLEEDTIENARLCLELAPLHCDACGDFHLAAAMRRTTVSLDKRKADDAEYRAAIGLALTTLRTRSEVIHVLIAGSTDTGIYSSLLSAATQVGGEEFARSLAVSLVDQCQTPLEVCKHFAKKSGLTLNCTTADILHHHPKEPVDLVLMHGVLPFFPQHLRTEYMHHIVGWISPGGGVISSSQLGERFDPAELQDSIDSGLVALERFIAVHGLPSTGKLASLQERVERGFTIRKRNPKLFADERQAMDFYKAAGLELASFWIVNKASRSGSNVQRYNERGIATCWRPD